MSSPALTVEQLQELRPITGGFHVRTLEQGQCVHLQRMIFNWRVLRWSGPCDSIAGGSDLYWCYQGTGRETFLLALGEALRWEGTPENPPEGWIKSYTGERRETERKTPEDSPTEDSE